MANLWTTVYWHLFPETVHVHCVSENHPRRFSCNL